MAKRVKANIYDNLRQALGEAAACVREGKVNLRVTRVPAPPNRFGRRKFGTFETG